MKKYYNLLLWLFIFTSHCQAKSTSKQFDELLNVKMNPEHIFRIGSITKQFTTSAVLQLAEEGKIDVDADINEYIKG